MTLQETLKQIIATDELAMVQAKQRWSSVAKPLNSLGLLEKVVTKIAGVTRNSKIELKKRAVVVMCADNGVVAQGVTQTDSSVTAIVAENMTRGESSVCKMAAVANTDVIPVDIGIARDSFAFGLRDCKIAYGTADMTLGPAMSREQAVKAIEVGINLVYELKQKGYQILATGEMGIGNTTTGSAVVSVLLGRSPEEVTGCGAGLSGEGMKRKIDAVRRAIALNKPNPFDAVDTLAKVGGFDIAGMAGIFLGGAVFHIPVLIDGFISSAAALVAERICPIAQQYMIASHASKEPAGQMVLDALKLKPFLMAEMCLGEGTGAVAVLPIIDMACSVYNEMSTFDEIHVKQYTPQGD